MCSTTSSASTTRRAGIRRSAISVPYSSRKLKKLRSVSTEPAAAHSAGVNDGSDAQDLRKKLIGVEPRFGSFGESQFRRVVISKELSLTELSRSIDELNVKLQDIAPII